MVKSDGTKPDAPKMEELVVKLKQIQSKFRLDLLDLHQKIEALDTRPELLNNLESFKKNAEIQASNLEVEIKELREQIAAFKDLLGLNKEKAIADSY